MKKYSSCWINNYQLVFQKTRIFSQIPVFILSVVTFLELKRHLYGFTVAESPADWVIPAIFQSFILFALLFARFLLLFSKSKISFCISQIIWAIYFLLIWNDFNLQNHHLSGDQLFILLYLFGSLIRQTLSLIASVFIKK